MKAEVTVTKTTEENCHNTLEERLAEQAEISFKAGIREVIDFVNRIEQSEPSAMSWSFRQRWQSKLKEWEIKK